MTGHQLLHSLTAIAIVSVIALTGCEPASDIESSALKAELERKNAVIRDMRDQHTELFGGDTVSDTDGIVTRKALLDGKPGDENDQDDQANCPSDIETFVRRERGNNCETYEAQIAGWSRRCVAECDDQARLAEAVADAQRTCAAFCRSKGCPGPRYSAPDECASSDCFTSSELCPDQSCSLYDSCYLVQSRQIWNCQCTEF